METIRSRSIGALLAVATSVGCGFDKLPKLAPDAQPDAPIPQGPHFHYIADELHVPTTNTEARDFGLDINGDGTTDNQLGMVFSTLGSMGLAIQTSDDTAVAEGTILILVDFQTEDFSNAPAAGLRTLIGNRNTVSPAACNTSEVYNPATKTGCKHHLAGTGSFTLDSLSPLDNPLAGAVVNGVFTGGPGKLPLQITVLGTEPIHVDVIGARVKSVALSQTLLPTSTADSVVIGGAITMDDLDAKFLPGMQSELVPVIARDCSSLTSPPACGCMTDSEGKTILALFDADHDCAVSIAEIRSNSLIVSLLSPDVMIDGHPSVSLGFKLSVVNATFPVPGE